MSDGKTHLSGESGVSRHHHRAGHHGDHEVSSHHYHSAASEALHHEASSSLSSPKAHHKAAIAGAHTEKADSHKPVKAAESVHLSTHAPAAKTDTLAHLAAPKAADKSGHILDLAQVPKLSIVNEKTRPTANTLSDSLSMLNPPPQGAERVAGKADVSKSLFAPQVKVEDAGKTNAKPSDSKPMVALPQFDGHKSIAELTKAGVIVDRTSMTQATDKPQLAAGEVPKVNVDFQNASKDQQAKPDFVIHKDGSVEMLSNPQVTKQKEINVQFERDGNKVELTDAQKAAGGAFYSYLQSQLKDQFPQAAADQFKTTDSQGLLKDTNLPQEVKKNIEQAQNKQDVSPSSGLPEKAGPTMQDTRRISRGGTHSDVPRSQVNDMTPPVKRIPNEAERMQVMKDTIASYTTRGEKQPYDHVSHRGERGWGVGRYGMTYKQVSNFMEGMTDDQIAELIKQGKLTPEQAANLKKMRNSIKKANESGDDNDLDPFLKNMKNGTGTAADMSKAVHEMFPDKVQELAASDQIAKISSSLAADAVQRGEKPSVDPGQVGLSFVLGRNVTKQEMDSNPEYKQFAESARQAYRLQEQSREQTGGVIHVENMSQVTDALNKMVGQQFWREAAGATEYGNKGCAIAVTRALQGMGVQIGAHLDVNGTAAEMRQKGWQEVSLAQAERSGQLYVAVNKET
ncbi:MAG: hypothetical protein K2X81_05985, partial [Candidatus Obscuribacterales bacterium]|nr:hypothetical protein [Candidatus Obscuribacterales bacterium]